MFSFRIRFDGAVSDQLTDRLVSWEIEERVSMPSRARIEVRNWAPARKAFIYTSVKSLELGADVGVDVEINGSWHPLFEGRALAAEADFSSGTEPRITFEAKDALALFDAEVRTRKFEELSPADIVQHLCQDHGLQFDDRGVSSRNIAQVMQFESNDFDFLSRLAHDYGFIFWVEGDTLSAGRSRTGTKPKIGYHDDVHDLEFRADLGGQPTTLSAGGWNPFGAEAVEATANKSHLSSPPGGTLATKLRKQAFGSAPEHMVSPTIHGVGDANNIARAAYRAGASRFVQVRGSCAGEPKIRAGRVVNISGVGPPFEGGYAALTVTHRWSNDTDFTTAFEGERAYLED